MRTYPITARLVVRRSARTQIRLTATVLALIVPHQLLKAQVVGPDAVAVLGTDQANPSIPVQPTLWGCVDGTQAYSTAGGVCNLGNAALPGNLNADHPMWTQNLYRLTNNRFEQIGMSWVKHDDWSFVTGTCLPCNSASPKTSVS